MRMAEAAVLAERRVAHIPSAHRSARREATRGDLFGHPKGLAFLFTTEMWERFSYYGMRALLVLYMTKYLLVPEHTGNVIGLAGVKDALEAVFGRLDVQPLSSQIYGFYTALVYLTPIFGGFLADRVLGQRRMVVIGAILMAIGHFMMAVEQLFLFALAALILGNGAFKPNISTQVGGLYAPGDQRRDRAYSIFYVGINVGAFLAPLVCGTLGEKAGWHYGFAAAGIGMLIGLSIYLYAMPLLPADELQKAKAAHTERRPLGREEWRAVVALLVLFVPTALFWATYEQQGNTIALWADANTAEPSTSLACAPKSRLHGFRPSIRS
jgi:proton-dependent oligopeptide transporter, POT family